MMRLLPTPFASLAWALTAFAPASAAEPVKDRPNILFIFTDDQSHRTVSCYPEAYGWAQTPNIDQLAKKGVRFTHAYHGAWCTPSRATMMTGHHPHGVESLRSEGKYPGGTYDPEKRPFWPKVFRKNGYVTAQIGKWHTGKDAGFGRDWDYQVVWNRPAHPDNAGNYYDDQLISINGQKPEPTKGYATDNYTRWAIEFIKGKNRDPKKPWFLWLCYSAPHAPHTPPERYLKAQYAGGVHLRPGLRLGPARLPQQTGPLRRQHPLAAHLQHAGHASRRRCLQVPGQRHRPDADLLPICQPARCRGRCTATT
jgi:arylsulfatase A-like enzyme